VLPKISEIAHTGVEVWRCSGDARFRTEHGVFLLDLSQQCLFPIGTNAPG
jgi:hypothetical protein